jgi:hypothetical protein
LLYIASSLYNTPRIRSLRDRFLGEGVALTFDWTTLVSGDAPTNLLDSGRPLLAPEEMARVAGLEAQGVARAKCVLMVFPGRQGTHFEMGMAYGLGIPIVVLNDQGLPFNTSFHYLPGLLKFNSEDLAVCAVLEILR